MVKAAGWGHRAHHPSLGPVHRWQTTALASLMRCSALMVVGSDAGLPGLAGVTTTCGSRPLPALTANGGGGGALLTFWARLVSPSLCFFLRVNKCNMACVPTGTLQLLLRLQEAGLPLCRVCLVSQLACGHAKFTQAHTKLQLGDERDEASPVPGRRGFLQRRSLQPKHRNLLHQLWCS